jgi:hypothetical protein
MDTPPTIPDPDATQELKLDNIPPPQNQNSPSKLRQEPREKGLSPSKILSREKDGEGDELEVSAKVSPTKRPSIPSQLVEILTKSPKKLFDDDRTVKTGASRVDLAYKGDFSNSNDLLGEKEALAEGGAEISVSEIFSQDGDENSADYLNPLNMKLNSVRAVYSILITKAAEADKDHPLSALLEQLRNGVKPDSIDESGLDPALITLKSFCDEYQRIVGGMESPDKLTADVGDQLDIVKDHFAQLTENPAIALTENASDISTKDADELKANFPAIYELVMKLAPQGTTRATLSTSGVGSSSTLLYAPCSSNIFI